MSKCASSKDLILSFAKVELYIITTIVFILSAFYFTHIVPIQGDIIQILFLTVLLAVTLYLWYVLTTKILSYRLAKRC